MAQTGRIEERALTILEALPALFSSAAALPVLLDRIKEAASAPHCLLAERDGSGRLQLDGVGADHPCIRGYGDADHVRSYFEQYRPFDDWERVRAVPTADDPIIYSGEPDGILPKSSPIREWFAPIDVNDNAYIRLMQTPIGSVGLNLHFDQTRADRADIVRLLKLIQRPLGHTLSVMMRADAASLAGDACPEFILNEGGRLILHNAAADQFLTEHAALLAANGTVKAMDPRENRMLQDAIIRALTARLPTVIALRCWDNQDSVLVAVMPLGGASITGFRSQARVKVRVLSAKGFQDDAVTEIAAAYGLTDFQSKMLQLTMRGFRPNEIARQLDRNSDYIREQMSRMYQVFDVNHQSALCAKVGALVAARVSA